MKKRFILNNDFEKNPINDNNNSFGSPYDESDIKTLDDAELKNKKLDIQLKDRFAHHTLNITYGWLGFIVLYFTADGVLSSIGLRFSSASVLIALISGTSLSVMTGLLTTILKYLFSKR